MSIPALIESSDQIGAVATLPDGRILTVYGDYWDRSALSQPLAAQPVHARTSPDNGQSWSAPFTLATFPAGMGAVSSITPLAAQDGTIHLFGLRFYSLGRMEGGEWKSKLVHMRSGDGGQTWSEQQFVDFGAAYSGAINSTLQLRSGRLLVPLSYLDTESESGMFVCTLVYSDDGGQTWARANDCRVGTGGKFLESGAIEPVLVELNSGLVWMIIRTTTGYFWESFSHDGAVWTPPRQTRIVSSNAPAGVLRLHDGRIVLFWNNLYGEPFRDGISYARQILSAAISANDGQTWSVPKTIAHRAEDEPFRAQTSYPFLCQAPDGQIVLMYHRVYAREGRDWMHPIREIVRVDPDWLSSTQS